MNKNIIIKLPLLKKFRLFLGVAILLSVMYQAYFSGEFVSGAIGGGTAIRLALKILAIFLLILSLKDSLSFSLKRLNMHFLFPIIYIFLTIFFLIPWLNSDDNQAVNFLLFGFLICLKKSSSLDRITLQIFKTMSIVILCQLIIGVIFYDFFSRLWENGAITGGMANPNVFGLFLLISAMYFYQIEGKFFLPLFLAASTIFTGSLISMLAGFFSLIFFINKKKKYVGILIGIVAFTFIESSNYKPIQHIFGKLDAVLDFLLNDDPSGSLSVEIRSEYYFNGIRLLLDNPMAIIFGHPNGILLYSGDGLYIDYLVSFGLIIFFYFVISNVVLIRNAIYSKRKLDKFFGTILGIYLIFFVTNRMLDYWPAAFPFLYSYIFLVNNRASLINEG